MAAPAVTLGAQTAWRFRRPLLLLAGGLCLLFLLPVIAVVAAIGSVSGDYRPSATALADIPASYLGDYQRSATRFGIDWAVLAAIGKVECDHGRSKTPGCLPGTRNAAGAQGPMQFLPATFAVYATDGNNDGRTDIEDPADAIASAARLLVADGAPGDYPKALFAYNHADWYVTEVLRQAGVYRGAWTGVTRGAGAVEAWATGWIGTPYVWGANHGAALRQMQSGAPSLAVGRDGRAGYFDCSSLVRWAYAKTIGIDVGDVTTEQWARAATAPGAHRGTTIPAGGLLPGDLVFFDSYGHVGLYLGADVFVEAPSTGLDVRLSRFSTYPGFVGWVHYDQIGGTP